MEFICLECSLGGGPFNQSEKLLDTLDYCPVNGGMGLKGRFGPFKACTYFSKTNCNAGRKY